MTKQEQRELLGAIGGLAKFYSIGGSIYRAMNDQVAYWVSPGRWLRSSADLEALSRYEGQRISLSNLPEEIRRHAWDLD